MKTRRITYLAAALALTLGAVSCEHDEIYEPLEFSVRLAPTNTYRAGDPVVFNFQGNADYITVWNGDTGHEYKYRNRTQVALEDIESCQLTIEISQQYGGNPEVSNLDMIAGNKFPGLAGNDAAADRPIVEAIAQSNYADWQVLEYTPNKSNTFETYTYDITPYADNFSFGLHLYQEPGTAMRTYRINPSITVKLKGYDTQEYPYSSMKFITFSLAPQHADDPYIHPQRLGQRQPEAPGRTWLEQRGQHRLPGLQRGRDGADRTVGLHAADRPEQHLARYGAEHQGRAGRRAELFVHLRHAGHLHGDVPRRYGQLPGRIGHPGLRSDLHDRRPARITRGCENSEKTRFSARKAGFFTRFDCSSAFFSVPLNRHLCPFLTETAK